MAQCLKNSVHEENKSVKLSELITLTPSRMTNGPFTPDTVLYAAQQHATISITS